MLCTFIKSSLDAAPSNKFIAVEKQLQKMVNSVSFVLLYSVKHQNVTASIGDSNVDL
jgi:hypothetical protein